MTPDHHSPDAAAHRLTRGDLLRRSAALCAAAGGGGLFAACSGTGASNAPPTSAGTVRDPMRRTKALRVLNWPKFIDTAANGSHPTAEAFAAQLALTDLSYQETITSNEAAAAQYAEPLSRHHDIGADVIVISDWMAYQWVQAGYAARLDLSRLPHVRRFGVAALKNRPIDPADDHLVPWQAGITGIVYDPAKVHFPTGPKGEPSSTTAFLLSTDYTGKLALLDNMRDTLGMVMLGLALDPGNCSLDDAKTAADTIKQLVDSGKAIVADGNYGDLLVQGKVAAGMAWSTDFARIRAANPDLRFLIPDDGCMIWSDDMLIPAGAVNQRNAHAWMDWYATPSVAATVTQAVRYTAPVKGVRASIENTDPENPLVQQPPGDRTDLSPNDLLFVASRPHVVLNKRGRRRMHVFRGLQSDEAKRFSELFVTATGNAAAQS